MNTQQETNKTVFTLDMICQQKTALREEIRKSKQRITNQSRELFHPTETINGANNLMNNFNSGITIFNGIMTGFKIIKRIRNLFRHK